MAVSLFLWLPFFVLVFTLVREIWISFVATALSQSLCESAECCVCVCVCVCVCAPVTCPPLLATGERPVYSEAQYGRQ